MSSVNSYDNLEYLLDIYYNFIYKSKDNVESKYFIKPIIRGEIKEIDIKKGADFDYDYIFENIRLKFKNYVDGKFIFTRKSNKKENQKSCDFTFGYYDTETVTMTDDVMYNTAMMYMTSEVVINHKFHHSILPVMLFDIDYNKLVKFIPSFKELENKYKKKEGKRKMYCLITENYFNMVSLKKFLRDNLTNLTQEFLEVLLFQIIYYLSKMQRQFKNFRHNNFNLESIQVYVKNTDHKKNKIKTYKLGKETYYLPDLGFDIKVGHYDKSSTHDYLSRSTMENTNDDKMVDVYYDIYTIINSLFLFAKKHKIEYPIGILNFMNQLVPPKFRVKRTKMINQNVILELDDMINKNMIPQSILLQNTFFKKYQKSSDDIISNVSEISNTKMKI
jgi:hypothetical protein